MTGYVIDASAYDNLIDTHEPLFAPELIDLEVAALLRKSVLRGGKSSDEATSDFVEWTGNAVQRVTHGPYLETVWALRNNITAYDAAYVALAMHLDVPLVTADRRLAAAAEAYCAVLQI
ncbi:MAG: twitching motility protein PilT [Schumannella sp.]|nr:twitching motility protein PilT [Schumannella sp.]